LVVRSMVRQLALPIEIVPAETVRDASGLALSSRNGYLNGSQRGKAAQLHAALSIAADAVKSGRSDWPTLEREAREFLAVREWQPDYVAIRRRSDLRQPLPGDSPPAEPLIVLAAARLGGTRLIDNLEI
jgi:pantoate--beta-alanine ligase